MLLSYKYLLKRRIPNLEALRLLFLYMIKKDKSFLKLYLDRNKKKKKYNYCKKKGHIRSECYQLKVDQKANLKSKKGLEKKDKNILVKVVVVKEDLEEVIKIFYSRGLD